MKVNVYLVCCNDAAYFAVVQSKEAAQAKLEEMKKAIYERSRSAFNGLEQYSRVCHWHLTEVDGEVGDDMEVIP